MIAWGYSSANRIISLFTAHLMSHAQYTWSSLYLVSEREKDNKKRECLVSSMREKENGAMKKEKDEVYKFANMNRFSTRT